MSYENDEDEERISVSKLLKCCVEASLQGCAIIQKCQSDRTIDVNGSSNSFSFHHLEEDKNDKTIVLQAKVDTQACIISMLRNTFGPNLRIVTEEDCVNNFDKTGYDSALKIKNFWNCPSWSDELSDNQEKSSDYVLLRELTLYVNPLDCTREFTEGKLENISCVIGVARNRRPLGGVIAIPFPHSGSTNSMDVYYSRLPYYTLNNDQYLTPNYVQFSTTNPTMSEQVEIKNDNCNEKNTVMERNTVNILTEATNNSILQKATQNMINIVSNDEARVSCHHEALVGACIKLRRVATSSNSIAILNVQTMSWDTCASEAIIRSKGGKITDIFGSPLIHCPLSNYNHSNTLGVIASSKSMSHYHDSLCQTMRADTQTLYYFLSSFTGYSVKDLNDIPQQAVDIVRDLDGLPIDKLSLQKIILSNFKRQTTYDGIDHKLNSEILKGYFVSEMDAKRGMMSNGSRVLLNWNDDIATNSVSSPEIGLPRSIFYKRIIMSDLNHAQKKLRTAPHKCERDVKSYQVETAFLTSWACQVGLRLEAGVHVPQLYASNHLTPASLKSKNANSCPMEQMEHRFSMILEDFSKEQGWSQQWLLDQEAALSSIQTLAKMHAYFWHGSNFWKNSANESEELTNAVWTNGGYMQPALQGYDQLTKVNDGWLKRKSLFLPHIEKLSIPNLDLKSLGEKLENIAKTVGEKAHPFSSTHRSEEKHFLKYRTLIHGDPKQANIFLRRRTTNDSKSVFDVGLIDFQWTGFGLAATDVAHFIAAAVNPDCISLDGKKEIILLNSYYLNLCNELVKHGVASSIHEIQQNIYPRTLFQKQYETALLDICRMVFAYAWDRYKLESDPNVESMNRNAYNKSLPNSIWLIVQCSQLLA